MSDKGLPGADAMSRAMDTLRGNAEEFSRLFTQMRFPGMPDGNAMLEAHRRNVEALTQANKVAIEGVQTVAKRHLELMHQMMGEAAEAITSLGSGGSKPTDQTELLRRAYERALAHARELSELIQQTNSEAASLLNRRFVAAMDEVKGLIAQANATKTD